MTTAPRATHYRGDQYDSNYPTGAENHWWNQARNRIVHRTLVRQGGASSPVLDVGCGRGIVVGFLLEQGIACEGVELGVPTLLPGLEPHIHCGTAAHELPETKRCRYETILLLDVIEHLPEPLDFLQTLCDSFERLTRIIVTVPAGPELWSNYDEYYGHHRRYTARTLSDLADRFGWATDHLSHFFRPAYPPMRLMVALGRRRRTRLAVPSPAARPVHRLVAAAMVAEYELLPARFPGTSLIACFSAAIDHREP